MTPNGQWTRSEILSQPDAWASALAVLGLHAGALQQMWQLDPPDMLLFTGCGSTYYLALAAAALAQRVTGLPCRGLPGSELWLYPDSVLPRQGRLILVAVSRSGETSETLRACQAFKALQRGPLLTLSCYADMPLAGLGDLNIILPSGAEQSVAQTRAFSTLYLAATYLALLWGGQSTRLAELGCLPAAGRQVLECLQPIAGPLGSDLGLDRFYFLGSGLRYGLACELSLKMKEMSLSHSEPFHFMEFRHGPKSMITPTSLVVGLLSQENAPVERLVLDELQAMGARVLEIGEQGRSLAFQTGLDDLLENILCLPVGQWLALQRSLTKGLNPDRPNNLESVVRLA